LASGFNVEARVDAPETAARYAPVAEELLHRPLPASWLVRGRTTSTRRSWRNAAGTVVSTGPI